MCGMNCDGDATLIHVNELYNSVSWAAAFILSWTQPIIQFNVYILSKIDTTFLYTVW